MEHAPSFAAAPATAENTRRTSGGGYTPTFPTAFSVRLKILSVQMSLYSSQSWSSNSWLPDSAARAREGGDCEREEERGGGRERERGGGGGGT